MEPELPDVEALLPAVLLAPTFECRGVPGVCPQDLAQVFDVRSSGFTLCARVRASGEHGDCRILQKGTAPAGWILVAPSRAGMVNFRSGEREKKLSDDAPAPVEEVAVPEPVDPKAKRKPSKDAKKGAAAAPVEAEVVPVVTDDFGTTRLDDGQWHHVAVVFRSGRIFCYVDGRPDGDIGMDVIAAPTAPLLMGPEQGEGAESAETATPPSGLQDVQIYSSALSNEQILGLATESKEISPDISLPFSPWEVKDFWQLLVAGKQSDAEGPVPSAARSLASECLGLGKDPSRSFQDEVICDFFVNLLVYAQSICLTPRKTAVFGAIMQRLFTCMFRQSKTTSCVGEPFSASECFLEYKRLLLDYAATAAGALSSVPSKRLQIFSIADVKRLTEYVSGTLFQHFFLYQCVIVNPQDSRITYTSAMLEQPRCPPVLRQGKLQPPKQDASAIAAQRKPSGVDADGQSVQSGPGTARGPGDGASAAGVEVPDGEEMTADATQMPGRTHPGAMQDAHPHDVLDYMVAEGAKAVEQQIESSIKARDEALTKT